MINKELLKNTAGEIGIELSDLQLEQFDKYAEMLVDWNTKMNLTGITEPDEIVIKHFVDCLYIFKYTDFPENASVIDVGTGAGFPGIVMLIARPDLQIVLLDSLQKRLNFLQAVLDELKLNATLVHARCEDAGRKAAYRERFDFAVARAVAPLNILCEYCLPFVKQNGLFVSMKGAKDERAIASNACSLLGAELENNFSYKLAEENSRNIVHYKKISQTSTKYPRNSAKISKQPL